MKVSILSSLCIVAFASIANADNSKSESAYYSANQALLDQYAADVSRLGFQLSVENHWDDDVLNGFAIRRGKVWTIETYGGLYRSPLISGDGYMAFLCHELGHHIAGAPFKPDIEWMSSEGQADYFSASVCLKRVWRDEDNGRAIEGIAVPKGLTAACVEATNDPKAFSICIRVGLSGFSFVEFNRVEHGYASESTPVRFDSPAQYTADHYINYPRAQCRLDTFVAGATGTERPRCWYVP